MLNWLRSCPTPWKSIPAVEEVLAKKAENRPITPEEFTMLSQFVDRVERRTIQIKEDAARAEEEKTASARVPKSPLQRLACRSNKSGSRNMSSIFWWKPGSIRLAR